MKLFAIVSVLLGLYNTGVLAIRGSELYGGNSPKDNRLFGLSNPFISPSNEVLGLPMSRQKELEDLAAARELATARAAASSRLSAFRRGFGSAYGYGI